MKKINLFCILFTQSILLSQVAPVCFKQFSINPAVGNYPESLCTADFNGDGKTDLACANYNGGGFSVLIGNGNGSFQNAANFSSGTNPKEILSADFNGDNNADLAVVHSNTVAVFLGNGNGTFGAAANYTAGSGLVSALLADFNGDNRSDLAIAGCNTPSIAIMFGNANGTFAPATFYAFGGCAWQLTVNDFNGDGKLDIAGPISGTSPAVFRIIFGTGAGLFSAYTTFTVSSGLGTPYGITSGDFNNDGKADVAVASNGNNNTLNVFIGTGTGSFGPPTTYTTVGPSADQLLTADFNADGNTDLAFSEFQASRVYVFSGIGNGSFVYGGGFPVNGQPRAFTKGDFNADGKTDLVTGAPVSNNLSVLLNTVVPVYSVTSTSTLLCAGKTATLAASGANTYAWSNGSTSSTIAVAPLSSTMYVVTGTSADACLNTVSLSLTVVPVPTISVNSGAICAGQTFSIIPSGASNYTVTGGSFTVSPLINSSYTVSGSSMPGCNSATNAVSAVTVNPLPVLGITSSTPSLCIGSTATLLASGALSYTWSNGGSGAGNVISPVVSTNYTVSGTDNNGCTNETSFLQVVIACDEVGVAEENVAGAPILAVFPHPAQEKIFVKVSVTGTAVLRNLLGIEILSAEFVAGTNELNLAGFSSGIYFLDFSNESYRIVKN